jgi:hypothetical protein
MARIGGLILLGLMGLWIAENPQSVSVVVLGRPLPPLPLGIWMTIAFGMGAGLGAIARWVWPPERVEPPTAVRDQPRTEPPEPKPPLVDELVDEDDEEWWEDLEPEPRDRPPKVAVEPPTIEEDEDEDDEDTYLIARYIRR